MNRRLTRIALVLASLFLGLCGANWIVGRTCALPAPLFRLDPVLLHALIPGARRILARPPECGGGRIATEIGEQGFRGPELAHAKRGKRVVVYGDSLVLAETTALEHTFVEQLGARLHAASGLEIEVVNAGVTGYGPDQECLKIEAESTALAPDLIVLVLCAHNDFGDLVRDKLFTLDAQGGLASNKWSFDESLLVDFSARQRLARRPALVRAWSVLLEKLRREPRGAVAEANAPPYIDWYLAAARDEFVEFVREHDQRVRTLFEDYYDADVALEPQSESARFKLALMGAVLARIADGCRARDVPLCVVVVPSAVDLRPDFDVRVDRARFPAYAPARLTDSLSASLARQHSAHVDLFQAFAAANPSENFASRHDFHWSDAGQALAARRTAELVLERAMLVR